MLDNSHLILTLCNFTTASYYFCLSVWLAQLTVLQTSFSASSVNLSYISRGSDVLYLTHSVSELEVKESGVEYVKLFWKEDRSLSDTQYSEKALRKKITCVDLSHKVCCFFFFFRIFCCRKKL